MSNTFFQGGETFLGGLRPLVTGLLDSQKKFTRSEKNR